MNLNLYLNELKQYRLSFLVWCLSICGLIILGMAFYPVIAGQDFLASATVLFEYPLMKNMMSAFNADFTQLTNIASFYITYTSIYVILTGCIFAVNLGSRIVSKEEHLKTAEFLFARPLSRMEIFVSKFLAFLTLLLALNVAICGSGIIGMELFKTDSSLRLNPEAEGRSELAAAFRQQPERFISVFRLTPDDYIRYTLEQVLRQVREDPALLAEHNLNATAIEQLLAEAAESPERLLEKAQASPESFRALAGLPELRSEELAGGIAESTAALAELRSRLTTEPALYVEIFESDPDRFLEGCKPSPAALRQLLEPFQIEPAVLRELFIYYPLDNYFVLSLYIFLLMFCLGSTGFFLSMVIPNPGSLTGAAIGITLGSYFINSLSNLTTRTKTLGYLSPFKFVDMEILNPGYGLQWWRLAYFLGISVVMLTMAAMIFRRKDIPV